MEEKPMHGSNLQRELQYNLSPIHLIHFSYSKKLSNNSISPSFDIYEDEKPSQGFFQYENDETYQQDQSDNNTIPMKDIFGNLIIPSLSKFQAEEQNEELAMVKIKQEQEEDDDKQNSFTITTPLKLRSLINNPNRSPLQDITPSLTKKKKKGKGKKEHHSNTEIKNFLFDMTPKEITETPISSQSMKRMKFSRM